MYRDLAHWRIVVTGSTAINDEASNRRLARSSIVTAPGALPAAAGIATAVPKVVIVLKKAG